MKWLDQLEEKEGYWWCVDLAMTDCETGQLEPNNDLIEVRRIGGAWMKRFVNETRWSIVSPKDGYKYFGPIAAPEYDFSI